MKESKLAVVLFAALGVTAGQAFAEGEEADPCGGGDPCAGDPCAGDPCAVGAPAAADPAAPGAAAGGLAGYAQAIIDRSLELPEGVLEVAGVVAVATSKPEGATESTTTAALIVGARYGVAPKLDAALSYAVTLKEFEAKGPLSFAAQYSVVSAAKMWIAARVSTGLDLAATDDAATDGSTKVAFLGIGLGVNFQYNITPKLAVVSPGDQLTLGFSDGVEPVALNLPLGFGFQASQQVYAFLNTSIGTIGLAPSEDATTLISDATLLQVGALFSPSNKLDVGAALTFRDVQHPGDALAVFVNGALRM